MCHASRSLPLESALSAGISCEIVMQHEFSAIQMIQIAMYVSRVVSVFVTLLVLRLLVSMLPSGEKTKQ